MAQELIYTSVPKGLKVGSDGYCTVAYTDGMPANVVKLLESFSDYSFLDLNDPNLDLSPVSFRHYKHNIGAQTFNIISRVAFSGFDYTRRSNKLAHHIVLSPGECCSGGPAWMCSQNVFDKEWDDDPDVIDHEKSVPKGEDDLRELTTWKELATYTEWAGKLAETYLNNPDRPSYIVYKLEYADKMLSLIREALKLIPEKKRWRVTFNTYFSGARNTECNWRCCLSGASVLSKARAVPGTLIIDLTSDLSQPEGGDLVKIAGKGYFINNTEPSLVLADAKKTVGSGAIAVFEENKDSVSVMPKLSLNIPIDDSIIETKESHTLEKPSLVYESSPQEQPSVKTKKEQIGDNARDNKYKEIPPIQLQKQKGANHTAMLMIIGGIIVILLLIIMVLLLTRSNDKTTTNNNQHDADSVPPKENYEKTVENTVPVVTLNTDKEQTEKTIKKNRNQGKSEQLKPELPAKTKPEDKKKIKATSTTPAQHKKIHSAPANVNIWLPYQQGIRDNTKEILKIPIPWASENATLDLVFKSGILDNIKEKLGSEPVKVTDNKLMIYGVKEMGASAAPLELCEFSIIKTEKGSVLIVKKLSDLHDSLDLTQDIAAVKINDKEYPLIYNGLSKLQIGEGKINDSMLKKSFVISFEYEFTNTDKLAGITPKNGKNSSFYRFYPYYNDKKINLKQKWSSGKIKFILPLLKKIPVFEKMYKEWQLKIKREHDKNGEKIYLNVKKIDRYKNYLKSQILEPERLEALKKENLDKDCINAITKYQRQRKQTSLKHFSKFLDKNKLKKKEFDSALKKLEKDLFVQVESKEKQQVIKVISFK